MNNRFGFIWRFISRHKYLIVVIIGVLVVGFLDENSFMKRIQYELQMNELEDQISKYKTQHEADSKKLRELRCNPKAIEKIARERYFMKADNEDIYVLDDDEQQTDKNDETTE